jgi:hypothetical protein
MNTNDRIEEMFIFVGYTTYVKTKNDIYAKHFYLKPNGKSTQTFQRAQKFFLYSDALEAAQKYYDGKPWYIFKANLIRSCVLCSLQNGFINPKEIETL